MKKLIISMKNTEDIFLKFKNTAHQIKQGKTIKSTCYEISFESRKDFNHFVKNMYILIAILRSKPHSIYQLALIINKDLSNVKKIISFFEAIGAVKMEEKKVSGRTEKKPVVDYDKIEFDLKAA